MMDWFLPFRDEHDMFALSDVLALVSDVFGRSDLALERGGLLANEQRAKVM